MNALHHLRLLYRLKALGHKWITPPLVSPSPVSSQDLPETSFIRSCSLCELSKARTHPLIPCGKGDILLVAAMPTPSEDETGRFFSGNTGAQLTKIIENVLGIKPEEVAMTTLLKCRPRTPPLPHHYASCRPYFDAELMAKSFKVIVFLGQEAYEGAGFREPFDLICGKVFRFGALNALTTYDPLTLIRNPTLKKEAFEHWLTVKAMREVP